MNQAANFQLSPVASHTSAFVVLSANLVTQLLITNY